MIENVYRLQLMNTSESAHRYTIGVAGLPGLKLEHPFIIDVPGASSQSVAVDVHAPPDSGKKGSNRIYFEIRALDQERVAVREQASFFLP